MMTKTNKKWKPSVQKKSNQMKRKKIPSGSYNLLNLNGYRFYKEQQVIIAIKAWADSYNKLIPDELLEKCTTEKCGICKCTFQNKNLPQKCRIAITHYHSIQHKRNAAKAFIDWKSFDEKNREVPELKNEKSSCIVKTYTCTVCKCTTNTETQLEIHLNGKRHQENFKNRKPSNPKAFHVFT